MLRIGSLGLLIFVKFCKTKTVVSNSSRNWVSLNHKWTSSNYITFNLLLYIRDETSIPTKIEIKIPVFGNFRV